MTRDPVAEWPPSLAARLAGYDPVPVTAGESGATLIRLVSDSGPALFLKHGAGRFAADVTDEMARLLWLADRLPTSAVRHFEWSDDNAWLLTEELAGQSGDDWFAHRPADIGLVVDRFAAFLRALHALPIEDCPFDAGHHIRMAAARRNIDLGLVDEDDFDDDHDGWSAQQVWDELAGLLPIASEPVVTHGDFSLGNLILGEDGTDVCIDVGRLGVADRYQDLAILWQNLREFGAAEAERFLSTYGLDRVDERRLRFHRCLDELF